MLSTTLFGNSQKSGETTLVHRNIKNFQQNQIIKNPNTSNLNLTLNKVGSSGSMNSESKSMTQTLGSIENKLQQMPPQPPSITAASQVRTLLPRPIITPNRTLFDKILDFIIGEGPNNR